MEFLFENLPQGWSRSDLDSIISFAIGGDWGKDPEHEASEYIKVLCIRGAEFRHWSSDKGKTASFRKVKASSLDARVIQCGDILLEISGGGPEQPVGRTVLIDKEAMAHHENVSKICTNFLRLLRPSRLISAAYLNEFLGFFYKSGKVVEYQAGSNNLRNLKFKDYMGIGIPIPPLAEQERIIFKLEELFSELDQGVENLRTAQQQLKVYRQALLKHAFEGKLTAEWRAQNPDKLECAEALLARIQQERKARQQQLTEWQEARQAWEANGKSGSKPAKPKAPKVLPPLTTKELAELPGLPAGWAWMKIHQLCEVVRGGSPRPAGDPKFYDGNIPFLKVADLTKGSSPYLTSYTYTIKEAGLNKTRQIKPNTLLLTNSGATLGVPKICLISATMNDGVAAFLGLPQDQLLYHYYFWQSQTERLRNIDQGAAQPNLNTDLIKETPIPVCSPVEQATLTQTIEAALSGADQLEQTITTSLQQAEALRQSILKKAFSGQLVPQHPGDEPASVLLARIRAERAARQPGARRDRRRRAAA
ncbi:restriction endonuclease subunit S [Thauera aromatica]|nr:restriction endonuclease subunit S [Thauera aromatica]MCK2125675.1 restriction endonuclease subunit S [Thauera aromatica]